MGRGEWRPSGRAARLRTMGARSCGLAVALFLSAGTALAQQVDVMRLPVDLDRIQKELGAAAARESRDGLNLKYTVDVFGRAPALVLFTEADNLKYGRAPYGGPTHQDMLEMMTPKAHRAPVADFSALLRWWSDRHRKR